MENNQNETSCEIEALDVSISSIGNDLDLVEEFFEKEEPLQYFVINI